MEKEKGRRREILIDRGRKSLITKLHEKAERKIGKKKKRKEEKRSIFAKSAS